MRLLRHPVAQFLLLGVLTITLISIGTNQLVQRAAEAEALAEARRINAVLARSVADPGITDRLISVRPGALDRYDRQVKARLLVGNVRRVNIWTASGRLIYSNAFRIIGQSFELGPGHSEILEGGGTGNERSDPEAPENVAAQSSPGLGPETSGELVRIYTRIRGGADREPLLFEAYYALDDIQERREEIYDAFRWITVGGPMVLVLLVTPTLWILTRQLTSASMERERLLSASLDASDAERRRIARDLHDGVVQDLAGTAFAVSAVARDPQVPVATQERLDDAGATLRDGLKALRSLLVEIHPPDLLAEGLAAALADLIAPAEAAGVNASVSVEGAETLSDERAALVWRVAQEVVRNALRHAGASTIAVTVRGDGDRLVLEVVDDGVGFDPRVRRRHSFGLRGLRSLVAEAGGTLDVRSSTGEGTTVVMEVAAQ